MSELFQITVFTLCIAAASTVLILPPGLALGWLLARTQWRGKALLETFVSLPLVIPPVATGLILLKIIGRRGPVGWLCEQLFGLQLVFTWKAVILATAVMSLPLLVRNARVAFEEVDRRLEETAATLGASAWDRFWTITLPMARRGLFAGTLLAFARALGEFGATIMVAGMIPGETITLSLGIYHEVQLGNDEHALLLLAVSASLAFGAMWLSERLLARRPA